MCVNETQQCLLPKMLELFTALRALVCAQLLGEGWFGGVCESPLRLYAFMVS